MDRILSIGIKVCGRDGRKLKTVGHDTMEENIGAVLDAIEIDATESQRRAVLRYCELVLAWNGRVNITGAKNVSQFISGPLFDALTLFSVLGDHHRLVDIGSGGGLPAVPLAILRPSIYITMVEPRLKRVDFLKMLLDEFQLNAEVLHTQDRELKAVPFDGATAQAVFPPKKWIARAKQLLLPGGKVYTLTSEAVTDAMLPNNIELQTQHLFERDGRQRFAARLMKG